MKSIVTFICLCIFFPIAGIAQSGSYAEYSRLSQATQRAFSVPDRYTITTYTSRVVSSPSSYSSSSSSSSSSSFGSSSTPISSGGNSWAMPCRNCNQTWGTSYQQMHTYAKRNYEQEAADRAKEKAREEARIKEQQRLQDEYNRQQQEIARVKAAEVERKRQIRLAFFKTRLDDLKQNPLQTIYSPPVFATAKEKFAWHYNEANHETGINDNYAKLIVAQMAFDGEGYASDLRRAINNNYDATRCGLSLCLAGEIKIAEKQKTLFEFENVLMFLHSATEENDITRGDERAYKKLLEIYRKDSLLGFKLPIEYNYYNEKSSEKCVSAKANVYAFAAKNGDREAAISLSSIITSNLKDVKFFSKKRLLNMAEAFPVNGRFDDERLQIWDNLGQKMELQNDTSCFTYYLKCLDKNNADKQIVNSMCVALARLSLKNPIFAKRLTVAQQKQILKNVNDFANSYDSIENNRGYFKAGELSRYFDCYWGGNGVAVNYTRATEVSKRIMLTSENDFMPIQKVALAYRLGEGGWSKDDKIASELFRYGLDKLYELTDDHKKMKAMYASTTADYWKANKALGLTLNNDELGFFLEEAARLDDLKGEEFADWVGNKKATYFNKEKAIINYTKAMKWYEALHDLFIKGEMQDTLTPKYIAEIKKKIANL